MSTPPFLERLQVAFAQVQAQATTGNAIPILATVVVGVLTLILVARVIEDHMSKGAETFYPTKAHSRVLSYKLVTSALSKGKKWQRECQKPGFQLCDRVLSARLPLAPRPQHVADMIRVCELPAEASHLPIIYPAVLMGTYVRAYMPCAFCVVCLGFWWRPPARFLPPQLMPKPIHPHPPIVYPTRQSDHIRHSPQPRPAVYPNCLLFAKAEYPFPAMGSVHVSNFTKIYQPLPVDEEYPATIKARGSVRPWLWRWLG